MSTVNEIVIASPADFHVHLRQGAMSEMITPHVALGGIRTAYVMPNLTPPLTSTDACMEYKKSLQALAPHTEFLMTLYLHPDITVEEVRKAHEAGVSGIKSYPRGVTTNSSSGIESYEAYYPVFAEMEKCGMVLNLHGEVPSDDEKNISVLNAEKHFLTHLRKLAHDFPRLRIVLEHATTKEAVDCVKSLPDNVACSITPHHLVLTIDAVAPQPFHFCKPIAKEPVDRAALRQVIKDGHPRFFLGSDSAPHPVKSKLPKMSSAYDAVDGTSVGEGEDGPQPCAAGVYTSSVLVPLVAHILDSYGALDKLEAFISTNGRKFYGVPARAGDEVKLRKVDVQSQEAKSVPGFYKKEGRDGSIVDVVPFMAGKKLSWELVNA